MLQITKRTLRFYDQIHLLAPSAVSTGGHRIYTDADIEKLYKIRLLKGLGFDLKQIRFLFEESTPQWDDLLQLQLKEIEAQLKKYQLMQEVIFIVQRSIKLEGKLDWENLFRYLRLLYEDNADVRQGALTHLFTEDELAFLRKTLPQMSANDPRTQAIIEVFSRFKHSQKDQDYASDEVQALVAQILAITNQLFSGREELRERVWRIQKEAPELLMQYPVDRELVEYVEKAIEHYKSKSSQST